MSMNSFSSRKHNENTQRWEDELSGLIDINLDGDPIGAEYFSRFRSLKFQPVNLDSLRKDWNDNSRGRRKSPRFNLQLTVLVCNCFKTFRTQSENISLSGILLKDLMPDDFSRHSLEILLIAENGDTQKTYLLFKGRAVDAPMRSNRVVFDSLTPDSETKLLGLIEDLTPLL